MSDTKSIFSPIDRSDGSPGPASSSARPASVRPEDDAQISRWKIAAWFLGTLVVYWCASRLGLFFTGLGADVSVCWPGAGLAVGAMVIAPRRVVPWIALAILISNGTANIFVGKGWGMAWIFAVLNSGTPWLASWMLWRLGRHRFDLREPMDVATFAVFGAAIPFAIAASLGAASFGFSGWGNYWDIWQDWWASDSLGVLLVAPVIIGWKDCGPQPRGGLGRLLEAAAMLAGTLAISGVVFSDTPAFKPAFLQLPTPIIPFLLWAALRFGVCGAGVAAICSAAIAVIGTRDNQGPFFRLGHSPAQEVTVAQGTIAIFSIASLVVATAIRARREREAVLKRERENADAAFDRSPIGKGLIDQDGRFIRVNEALCRMLGRSRESLLGHAAPGVLNPGEDSQLFLDLETFRRGGEDVPQRQAHSTRPDGSEVSLQMHLTAVRGDQGTLVHSFAQFIDLTRERRAEQAVRESEGRLKLALGNAGHGLWDWDMLSGHCVIDEGWQAIHGYRYGEMKPRIETWTESVHPDDRERVHAALEEHLKGRTSTHNVDHRARRKDGSWIWINTRGKVTHRDQSGRPLRMMGTIHDITARKAAEERLRRSVRDKDVLLREIHHRVKNNLTAVSGLLLLRSNQTDSPELKAAFTESRDRVRAIGLIHDTLHRSENLAAVDLAAYLRSLATQISGTFAGGAARVDVEVRSDPINLDIYTAVPCGLIVNEMLTNCYKHAFAGRTQGRILVDAELNENRCTILVRDDGVGGLIPEDYSKSLGLQLMHMLAGQIGGEVWLRPVDPGIQGRLSFLIQDHDSFAAG